MKQKFIVLFVLQGVLIPLLLISGSRWPEWQAILGPCLVIGGFVSGWIFVNLIKKGWDGL